MIPVRDHRKTDVSNGVVRDEKFRKKEHILKTRDFGAVYKKGRSVKDGAFVLCVLPNGLCHSRLGFSIGARNVKRAHSRARIKRLFREAYRRNKAGIKTGFDLVLIARKMPEDRFGCNAAERVFLKLAGSARVRI